MPVDGFWRAARPQAKQVYTAPSRHSRRWRLCTVPASGLYRRFQSKGRHRWIPAASTHSPVSSAPAPRAASPLVLAPPGSYQSACRRRKRGGAPNRTPVPNATDAGISGAGGRPGPTAAAGRPAATAAASPSRPTRAIAVRAGNAAGSTRPALTGSAGAATASVVPRTAPAAPTATASAPPAMTSSTRQRVQTWTRARPGPARVSALLGGAASIRA